MDTGKQGDESEEARMGGVEKTVRPLLFGAQAVAEDRAKKGGPARETWSEVARFLVEVLAMTEGRTDASKLAAELVERIAGVLTLIDPKHAAFGSLTDLACDLLAVRDGRDPLFEGPDSRATGDYLSELITLIQPRRRDEGAGRGDDS